MPPISVHDLAASAIEGPRAGRQPRSFVAQVMKAAAKANGGPLTLAKVARR